TFTDRAGGFRDPTPPSPPACGPAHRAWRRCAGGASYRGFTDERGGGDLLVGPTPGYLGEDFDLARAEGLVTRRPQAAHQARRDPGGGAGGRGGPGPGGAERARRGGRFGGGTGWRPPRSP